jgi:hypothetical protein
MDAVAYYISYSSLEKWSLKWTADGKLLEMDSTWIGLYAMPLASPPTPTYSTLLPFAGYLPTIKFSDGVASNDVSEMQIDFEQKCALWYPANGTQDFVTVYFGERLMKVDFTARFDNTTIYDKWRNNTNDSLTVDFKGPVISTTYNQELSLTLATISYDSVEHDLGKENVMIKAKATALVPFGSSLVSGYVQNTVSSYTA